MAFSSTRISNSNVSLGIPSLELSNVINRSVLYARTVARTCMLVCLVSSTVGMLLLCASAGEASV